MFLPAGASGAVAVTVKATNLPGDGVPGTGDATDQDFALVCDNCSPIADLHAAATPSRMEVCAPANATFPIAIGSILGYSSAVTPTTSGVPGRRDRQRDSVDGNAGQRHGDGHAVGYRQPCGGYAHCSTSMRRRRAARSCWR